MNLDVWLSPVSENEPCGPNLEYDADFQQLEEAARSQPDLEFGNQKTEGSSPAWADVRRRAEALLTRTKDLRVALYLLRALIRTEGIAGLLQGTMLIKGLLENYWPQLHPALDTEDNNDPTMRVNALAPLIAADAVLDDVRHATVARSRQHGTLTVRDIDIAQGRRPPREGSAALTEAQLDAAISAALTEHPALAAELRSAYDAAKAIGTYVAEQVGSAASIDMKPLLAGLYPVLQLVEAALPPASVDAESEPAMDSPDTVGQTPAPASGKYGELRSRADVISALERICEFLARTEPTSPVPILLRRAQRMMSMSFLELMQDMAPDGLPQAEKVVGERLKS